MKRLTNVCVKLDKLKNISGKNAKQDYIRENKEDADFLELLEARLNPFTQYGIKKMPRIEYALKERRTLTYSVYINLLSKLSHNNINDLLRKYTVKTLSGGNYEHAEILEGIITKSLNIGVDTGVKKALGYDLFPTFDVMLAMPLKEGVDVPIPCQVDIKYDGVRCIAMVENGKCTMYTRQGRKLSFPKLEKEVVALSGAEDMTFDGELEMKARTGISGVCNSNLKTGYTEGADDFIEYILFDEIPTAIFKAQGVTKTQETRTLDLAKRFMGVTNQKRVLKGESQTVYSEDKLREINNKYIADGLEGVIAKDPKAVYHYKRNKAWLKLKAINSVTLKVVATELGKGKRKGKVGALVCESEDGLIKVNVGGGLSDELVDTFTKRSPKGLYIEVLFNVLIKGRDSDVYSLFLPRYKETRIDKTAADTLKKAKSEHIGKIEE